MKITLKQAQDLPPGQLKDWAYNALDVTGTREVADTLLPRLTPDTAHTYAFERALQNPAFDMMTQGVKVNVPLRAQMVTQLKRELTKEERLIGKMPGVVDIWDGKDLETGWCPVNLGKRHKWPKGVPDEQRKCEHCGTARVKHKPFEPGSTHQVKKLFYELHKIKPLTNKKHEVSVDDDVLEKIGHKYPKLQHITEAIRNVRDLKKQLGSLNAKLTGDNRYPSSFNVGAAWTGRFSSSKNPFGLGGNLQNWAERHRIIAEPDNGYELAYIDLKQAESNYVAHEASDEKYIEAHKSGDVHTYVTRLVWPVLPWTWDLKKDKAIAKQNPTWDTAPGHDFRFQAKRIQHGSNYGLSPFGIALIAHIPVVEATKAQGNYFRAFPGIPTWQNGVAAKIRAHEPLKNLLGRTIYLFGRPWDAHTVKQGLSFSPQSGVADILDLAMLRIWRDIAGEDFRILAQVHDALLVQFKKGRYDLLKRAVALMRIPVPVNGRVMVIEPEVAVGMNWAHQSKENPEGIREIDVDSIG